MPAMAEERVARDPGGGASGADFGLEVLLRQLQGELGLNFRQYKPNYLKRRIGVRMRATGCSDYLQYRQYLRQHPGEARRLINDLTINVTEFFRDGDVYEAIRRAVIPDILDYKRRGGMWSLRAWSAGCATGEEPYSLAILILEALAREGGRTRWAARVTATDLDDKALERAKAARYEEVNLLPGLELDDYFMPVEGGYAVRDEVRRLVRFLLLDLAKPPPLRHLDLILCRNVLIYFERDRQSEIMEIFHRSLRPGGFLVLGKSEAIVGAAQSGFAPFRRRERIYRKRE
ncbi:MAG: protein-glutamate O-methyltransferase CheR [Actinobacteria bacterium]|nr:protein-glutamate O-methyltransferase CheR [Actinomycetota bacterium]